jgi:5-methylcytosine-specific restriction endonuclease McrA
MAALAGGDRRMSKRAEYMRRWRAANREHDRALNRACYARNREKRLAAKRERYQSVVKPLGRTDEGRWKERDRKARRRSLIGSGRVSAAEWQAVLDEHGHRCAYCGRGDRPLEQDHVIPLSKGGRHAASNIVPACKPCNSAKGARCG